MAPPAAAETRYISHMASRSGATRTSFLSETYVGLVVALATLGMAGPASCAPNPKDFPITFNVASATVDDTYCWMTVRFSDQGVKKAIIVRAKSLIHFCQVFPTGSSIQGRFHWGALQLIFKDKKGNLVARAYEIVSVSL